MKQSPRKTPRNKKEAAKTVEKRRRGRPTSYNLKTAEAICEQLAAGASLVAICKQSAMPSYSTAMAWLRTHDEFLEMYRLAREDQADTLADEIIAIADSPAHSSEEVQRNRLRVDARKWIVSKLRPRRYGDKVALTGPNDGPIKTDNNMTVRFVNPDGSDAYPDAEE